MNYPPENRTPKEWINNCLQILKEINPNYRLNKNVKGTFIEFIREDYSGIFISVNFYRKRVFGEDTYHLCFGLSLTSKDTFFLEHPLLAGSRFDTNDTIWSLLSKHLRIFPGDKRYPKGVWSIGEWQSNTMELLKMGLAIPEEYLLPFYQNILKGGKERLLNLFNRAAEIVPKIVVEEPFKLKKFVENQVDVMSQVKAIGIDPELVLAHRNKTNYLTLLNIAKGGKFGPQQNAFDMDTVPVDAIIMNNIGVFLLEKDRLGEIVNIIEKI